MDNIQRSFIIGDEWLYFKIYTGYKSADDILTDVIKPMTQELIDQQAISKWFFIRYADPENHLRIRFQLKDQKRILEVSSALNKKIKPLIIQDIVWKLQADTYIRELERYDANGIELAEELFYHDSQMMVDFLILIEGNEGEKLRWLFAIKSIYSLLDSFEFKDADKIKLMARLSSRFGREFNMNRKLKMQLDKKFREYRNEIESFLESHDKMEYHPINQILEKRSNDIKNVSKSLRFKIENGIIEKSMDHLMGSYIHMTMNRLFKSKARMHEMVCYNFMERIYKSQLARKKVLKMKSSLP